MARRGPIPLLLAVTLLTSCGLGEPEVLPNATAECPRFDQGRAVGRVVDPEIDEASGLVASRRRPGAWWTHNGSGDGPRLFALGPAGEPLGGVTLPGVQAKDWEDVAIGPGPGPEGPGPQGSWITVGDIGDNPRLRSAVRLYRFEEPRIEDGAFVEPQTIETWTVTYEDGPHNAETLLVDPLDGQTFIVTKEATIPAGVYRIDLPGPGERPAGGAAVARRVAELPILTATAGDVRADGAAVLVRGYDRAFLWIREPGEDLASALAQPACEVPLRDEPQGEAIAFSADGSSYSSLSERVGQPLWTFRRVDARRGDP